MSTNIYPGYIDLKPVSKMTGTLRLPGSKSISNRTLLLSALSDEKTVIKDLLISEDTLVMLDALKTLGIQWEKNDKTNEYIITGQSGHIPNLKADLFLANAGTAIRPLAAVLAVIGGDFLLHGIDRMHERPIGDLVDALNASGACIEYTQNKGYPPIRIKTPKAINHVLHVKGNVSSQFLTALLMASPLIAKKEAVTIHVVGELISKPYIAITLNLMRLFGIDVKQNGWSTFEIAPGQVYKSPKTVYVEGDASSASYFLAGAAITGGPVRVDGVGKNSIQGDIEFVRVLEKMGAQVIYEDNAIVVSSNGILKAIDDDFNLIPDAAMTVAMLALYADGTSRLRNIGSWRVKETDRLQAMSNELKKLGAHVQTGPDWIEIKPPSVLTDATIDTYNDHRMAMCFSLACLSSPNKKGATIRINNPSCVTKTFPEYFIALQKLLK